MNIKKLGIDHIDDLVEIIVTTLDNKLGNDISVIYPDTQNGHADVFIVVSSNNINHSRALKGYVEDKTTEKGYSLKNIEGSREGNWILMDYGTVVVHIFTSETREYYDIEDLYNDYKINLEL